MTVRGMSIAAAGRRRLRGVLWACLVSASAAPASSAELQIDLHDDRLSLRTDALPLEDVLSRIGNRAGIAVTIAGDLGGVRPQQFDDVPLAAAIPAWSGSGTAC